jgi:SAM-dependent methyltransferase
MSTAQPRRAATERPPRLDALLAWRPEHRPRVAALLALRRYWMGDLFSQLRVEYEERIAGGNPPVDFISAEPLVQELPSARRVQWLHRYIQDANWRLCREVADARLDEIAAAIAPHPDDLGTLELEPDVDYPGYYEFDFHRQEAGIWRGLSGAIIYLLGARVVHKGNNDNFQLHDQFVGDIPPLASGKEPVDILDIGCGFGKTTFSLKKAWPEASVHGVDLADPCLRLGRRMASERGWEIHWRQGDMEKLPYADNSLDLATITMVLHELPKAAIAASMREAARVLRSGGQLVILENRLLDDDPFRNVLLKWYSEIIDEPYSIPFRMLDLPGVCRAEGFADVEVRKWYLANAGGPEAEADPRRWCTPWRMTIAKMGAAR